MSDFSNAILSKHCLEQLTERKLSLEELAIVLKNPDEVLASGPERVILHRVVVMDGKTYLWRVVIDVLSQPPRVITAYITNKLKKYIKEH